MARDFGIRQTCSVASLSISRSFITESEVTLSWDMFPRQSIYATIINRRVWLLKVSIFLCNFSSSLIPVASTTNWYLSLGVRERGQSCVRSDKIPDSLRLIQFLIACRLMPVSRLTSAILLPSGSSTCFISIAQLNDRFYLIKLKFYIAERSFYTGGLCNDFTRIRSNFNCFTNKCLIITILPKQ